MKFLRSTCRYIYGNYKVYRLSQLLLFNFGLAFESLVEVQTKNQSESLEKLMQSILLRKPVISKSFLENQAS